MVDFNRRDRDDRGSSRDRGDDRRSSRGSDRDDRGGRDRDDRGGRDRDDRGSSRDRGGREERSSGSSSRFEYTERSHEQMKQRQAQGGQDFDKMVRDGVKMYKVRDGENRLRILPPTWPKPKHYGYDIFMHYGVGPDRASYIDLFKMKGEPDPVTEERERLRMERDPDEDYIKDLDSKKRVGVWVIDRNDEKEGVQFWPMPWTVDRDIVAVSVDRDTGEVLPIDHPDHGYDIIFDRTGKDRNTKYTGVSVARRASKLGKDEWLDYAMDNPVPDVLVYHDYDTIAKAFGAKGEQRERPRTDDRDSSRDGRRDDRRDDRRDPPPSRERERDDRSSSRSSREEPTRRSEPEKPTWKMVHEMTGAELDDLVEQEKLDIDPRKAKDDEDLADWICDEMKIDKEEAPPPARERRRADDAAPEDKLASMRNRRRED